MDRVYSRLFGDLKRFLIFNANLHLAGGLDLFVFIFECDVVEPGKRQLRILIVLILHLTQGLFVVLLVLFGIFLLCDLPDIKNHAHRKSGGRSEFGVDIIVLAFKNKLCILCDQLNGGGCLGFGICRGT